MAPLARSSGGARAERLVHDRLRAALPAEYRLYPNVHWLLREHHGAVVREGEADLLVAHPELGLLVIEVKAGHVRREPGGRWWAGRSLDRSPFAQARDSHHSLVRKLCELPDWEAGLKPVAGHAVAFPDIDLRSAGGRLDLLGPDADPELVLDQPRLLEGATTEARVWVETALRLWAGRASGRPPGEQGMRVLAAWLEEPVELRSLLRNEIAAGEGEVLAATTGQLTVLNRLRSIRRAAVVGGAGTGKTLLAAEKARRLVGEGYRTLLVCFNSALAGALIEHTADVAGSGLLTVCTFHQLCEDLGRAAGTLPPKPAGDLRTWFDETLPRALDEAIATGVDGFHAVVVDEGQDFAPGWLLSLDELLVAPREDVLYVFHDPGQAIYRDDAVPELGLVEIPLDENCRNTQPIHDLVVRLAEGRLATTALRAGGRAPELLAAEDDAETLELLRQVLHRLRRDEAVNPWDLAVLTGCSLEDSAVWRQRRFGNEVLDNPAVDDAGRARGYAAHEVPDLPSDAILCDSIRRFKGLERPVVVLVDLRPDERRLDRLLYVGASRARQHLVVIAPRAVLDVLRNGVDG